MTFINNTVEALEAWGFKVDVYQSDRVTVDFYRKLPSYGYKLILFRAHSGALEHNGNIIGKTFLFTSEPYSESKYNKEQTSDQIAVGRINEQLPPFFTIGHKFVMGSMEGTFSNTVIIMMGCSALRFNDMGPAMIEKGASAYLGWDATVDLSYVDDATLKLISNLFLDGMILEDAVIDTMTEVGPDPTYNAWLHLYPEQSASYTITELIHQA
jgi:hypothetical protein